MALEISFDLLNPALPLGFAKSWEQLLKPLAWILALRKAREQACRVVELEVAVLVEGVANENVGEEVNVMAAASGSNLEGVKEVGPFVEGMKVAVVAVAGVGIAGKLVAVQMPKEMDVDRVEEVVLQEA